MVQLLKLYFVTLKSKIHIIIDTAAKNLETVVYIIAKKTSKAEVFSNTAVVIFVYHIFIIKLDNVGFSLCCLLN